MSNQHPVITLLESLGATLTEGKISIPELAAQLGDVREEAGGTTYVTPRDPLFKEITIAAWRGETRPRIVSLRAADPKQFPSLPALQARFGKYGVPAGIGRAPVSAVFRHDFKGGRPWVAVIGATLASQTDVDIAQRDVIDIYIDTERR